MKAEINGIVFEGQASEFIEMVLALQAGKSVEKPKNAEKNRKGKNFGAPEWTDAEKRILWSMKAKGSDYPEIAEKLRRSVDACRVKCSVLRHSSETKKLLEPPQHIPKKRHPRKFKTWTDEEKKYVLDAQKKAVTIGEIARNLGRPKKGTYQMLYQLKKTIAQAGQSA